MTDLRYSLLSLLTLLAILGSIVIAPSTVAAQTAGLEQYQPNPGNTPHSGDGGGGASSPSDDGQGAGGGVGGGPSGTGGSEGAGSSGGHGRGEPEGTGPDAVPTSAGATEHPLGTIPLTDYPLTPLLLGVILLLVAGLIARLVTYLAGRRRQPPTPA